MSHRPSNRLIVGAVLGILMVASVVTSDISHRLTAQIVDDDVFLLLQVLSDYDRDGDIDFLDFTVFSAFYEETL